MSHASDLAALRQRLIVEVAEANLRVLACQEKVARLRQQLKESDALLADTRAHLLNAHQGLEAANSMVWTTLPKQQPERD